MVMQDNGERSHLSGCSEAMSRLIDGELDAGGCRELFHRLGADAEARRAWILMNVACDAVRSSETAALHSGRFVARVSAALESEPVVLAPAALARRRNAALRRVVLPAAAVAAAAAVLAFVAVPQLRGTGGDPNPIEIARQIGPGQVAPAGTDVTRSPELEAYYWAHRESAGGPVTTRANEYFQPATATRPSEQQR
jgi:sigma-E factor negative regulatory protein RseA